MDHRAAPQGPEVTVADKPQAAALGVLPLIPWSLTIVVTAKYVLILLCADNNGEGGTLSIMALASRAVGARTTPVFLLDIDGAAMFCGLFAVPAAKPGMPSRQDKLFSRLAKSASDATDFFQIPTGRVVEVGAQVTV